MLSRIVRAPVDITTAESEIIAEALVPFIEKYFSTVSGEYAVEINLAATLGITLWGAYNRAKLDTDNPGAEGVRENNVGAGAGVRV